jgi:hypothetical protein
VSQTEPTETPPDINSSGVFQIIVNRPPFQDKGQMVPCNIINNYETWNEFIESSYGISIKFNKVPELYATSIVTASYYASAIEDGKISGLIELNYDDYANIAVLKEQGLILPFDEYLKDNGAYQSLPESMRNAFVFADGKTWALSAATPTGIYSRKLRKEWLSDLDLTVPQNAQELYEVAKAFTYKDPNGNGLTDEHGMDVYFNRTPEGLKDIFISFDCYLSNFGRSSIAYDYSTGTYEDAMLKPEMKEALQYIKNMLDENILHTNTDWSYSSNVSEINGNWYSESARTLSEDPDVWTHVYTLSTKEKRSVLIRGPEKCFVLTADTEDPGKTINGFVNAFYSDFEGMLAGVYGEESINYTVDDNVITGTWNLDLQEKFTSGVFLIQHNYHMFYEHNMKIGDSYLAGKVENLEILNRYFNENSTIIDLLMPLHSDYQKVQLSFTNALNAYIENFDSISIDDFIANYKVNSQKAGYQDILDDLNKEKNTLAKYTYR